MDELINLITNNGISVVCMAFMMYIIINFMTRIDTTLITINESEKRLSDVMNKIVNMIDDIRDKL